jgi:tetratricopeptide (TPR) repeat protein
MHFISLRSIILFNLLILGSGSAGFAQEADKIYPSNGVAVSGKIAEMTRNGVVMEVRGVKTNYDSNIIQRIVFEGEPAQFTRAKEDVVNEQWDQALESLKKVDFKSIVRDDVRKDFNFYVGFVQSKLALVGQGDPQAAEARLFNFVKETPQSFHFYDSSDALGSLAAAAGGHDRAVRYFAALAASPYPADKIRAQFAIGNSQLALGNAGEALTAFKEASAINADDATAKRFQKFAAIGMLRCETAEKKFDSAIEKLRKLVSESDATDGELFARLYNALGEAHLQAGQQEEAALAYLHTDLLFTNDSETHAEALYNLVQLFAKLDPPRVADAKERLKSMYSNSAWAKKI